MDNEQSQSIESYREVDFKEFVEIFWKRKKMIFLLAVLAGAAAFFAGLRFFKYQAAAVIEIGNLGAFEEKNGTASYLPIEPPLAVREKIKKSVYGAAARENDNRSLPEVDAFNTAGTNIVQIVYRSRDLDLAKKHLDAVCAEIVADHVQRSARQREIFGFNQIDETRVIKKSAISKPDMSVIWLGAAAAGMFAAVLGMFLALIADWWRREK